MPFEETLPWDAKTPDADLVRLVHAGEIPRGQALDLGTGRGYDAVFLLENAFDVIGVDQNPLAIRLARENASHHGYFGYFQLGDVRRLPIEDAYVDVVVDCGGCIQALAPAEQDEALRQVDRVLSRKGLFLFKVYTAEGGGAHGVDLARWERMTSPFRIMSQWASAIPGPSTHPAYGALLAKR